MQTSTLFAAAATAAAAATPSLLFDARLFLERTAPSMRETGEWKDDEVKVKKREREEEEEVEANENERGTKRCHESTALESSDDRYLLSIWVLTILVDVQNIQDQSSTVYDKFLDMNRFEQRFQSKSNYRD